MALTVREVRDRIAEGLTTHLGSSGWTESRFPAEKFGDDTREQRHLAFSVEVPSTTTGPDRQNTRGGSRSRASIVQTRIVIRWGHLLTADGEARDYSAALDAEARLVDALLNHIDRNPELGLTLVSLTRRSLEDGLLLEGQVTLDCLHILPLD